MIRFYIVVLACFVCVMFALGAIHGKQKHIIDQLGHLHTHVENLTEVVFCESLGDTPCLAKVK